MAYDSNIANSYLVNGDYDNLTKYLSKFHFTDANKQKQNQNNIMEARSRARVQEGLLSKASNEQAQALKFMNAWDSGNNLPNVNRLYNKSDGSITKENMFSNRASKAIRSFFGNNATGGSVIFAPKTIKRYGIFGWDWTAEDKQYENDAFTDFENNTGMSKKYLMQAGIKFDKDSAGNVIMNFNTTSPLAIRIIKGLQSLKDNEDGNYRFKIAGIDTKGKLIDYRNSLSEEDKKYNNIVIKNTVLVNGQRFDYNGNPVTLKKGRSARVSANGDFYNGDGFYAEATDSKLESLFSFDKLNNVINEASTQRDILIGDKDENGEEATNHLSGTFIPSLGAGYSELNRRMQNGSINVSKYNAIRKAMEDQFSQALAGNSLTQYEMYVTNPDTDADDSLSKIEDSNDRRKYQSLIINALGTDRIHYGTYTNGQQSGTMIIINPMMKDKKDKGKTTDIDDINTNALKIFVPDLFKTQVDATLKSDTKYRAIKELSNAQMYKYDLTIPNDGKIRINRDENGNIAYKFIDDASGEITDISQADALNHVNKMLIQEDITDKANSLFYNEDGEFRQDIVNKDGTVKDSFQKEVNDTVKSLTIAAMSELNPQSFKNYQDVSALINNPNANENVINQAMSNNFTMFDDYNFIANKMQRMSAYILANIGYNSQDPYNSFNIE